MAIVMGVLGLSLRNMQGPSTQVAAAQVASGLSLARQIAISKNTETRFVIYGSTTGATGNNLPPESWRYWTILSSNKEVPNNLWVMEKEWEKLPEGAVFLNLSTGNYSTIFLDPIGNLSVSPKLAARIPPGGGEYEYFQSFGTFRVSAPAAPGTERFSLSSVPVLGYLPSGEVVANNVTSAAERLDLRNGQSAGIRLADGVANPNGSISLRSTNNFYYVETDRLGRVRVRARESFRERR